MPQRENSNGYGHILVTDSRRPPHGQNLLDLVILGEENTVRDGACD